MTDVFFAQYLQHYQPFKQYWNYEDGCVLLGCRRLYEATGSKPYAQFVLDYLSGRVTADGQITTYLTAQHCLDSFNCGKALFLADALTHDPRWKKAIRWQAARIAEHPRTKDSGLCWHKQIYPEQVWIDGVYMTAPFFAEYAEMRGETAVYPEIARWFRYLRQRLFVPQTGLYLHAVDEARVQPWADPETGLSRTHWLRGEGWLLMALADVLALLPPAQEALREQLTAQLREAADGILQYRTENGLLCQVIDRPALPGNYEETSGSLMTAYALMCGALPAEYAEAGLQMLEAVKRHALTESGGGLHLTGICGAAGLGSGRDGSAEYYLSEPVVADDPKGVGALMLAEAAAMTLRVTCNGRSK